MKEYKLIGHSGKNFEAALNSLAAQGWRVLQVVFGGEENSDYFVLERDCNKPAVGVEEK